MNPPSANVLMVTGYAGFLIVAAYGFDRLARNASTRAARWRTGAFTYHADHDAWVCPQDQWLWPQSFDPDHRVMRYRASPAVCNACPVKHTCTTSPHGREVSREVDPWPHSEAGRFHRGIACLVAALGVLLPAGMLLGATDPADVLTLVGAMLVAVAAGLPLARHLWRTPSGFPEHVPHETRGATDQPAPDRFATRWGAFRVDAGAADGAGSSRIRGGDAA